jgi:hypothetical protein
MNRRNRLIIAIITGVTVFTTVFAVAASLNVTAATLGAGTGTVSSCDTNGVTTTFDTAYSAAVAGYEVTTVHVSGIATPGCDGRTMKVTLVGAADAALAEVTVTLATPVASPTDFDFTSDNVLAASVLKVSVVVA